MFMMKYIETSTHKNKKTLEMSLNIEENMYY